jgi:hypothetical protein
MANEDPVLARESPWAAEARRRGFKEQPPAPESESVPAVRPRARGKVTTGNDSVSIEYRQGTETRELSIPVVEGTMGESLSTTGKSYCRFTMSDGTQAVSFEPKTGNLWDAALLLDHVAANTNGDGMMPRVLGVHMHEGRPRLVLESFQKSNRLDMAGKLHWSQLTSSEQAELTAALHPDIIKEFRQTGLNHPLMEAEYLFLGDGGRIRIGLPRRVDNFAKAVYGGQVFRNKTSRAPSPDGAPSGDTMPTRPAASPEESGVRSNPDPETKVGDFSNFSPQEQAAKAVRDLEYVYDFLNGLRAQNDFRYAPPTSPVKVRGSTRYVSDLSGDTAVLRNEGIEFQVDNARDAAKLINHIAKNAGDIGQLSIPLKFVRRNGPFEAILETPSGRPVFVRAFSPETRPSQPGAGNPSKPGTPEYGVAFFGKDNYENYYSGSDVLVGAPGGRPFFFMPLEDAQHIKNPHDAARYSGMAPSAERSYRSLDDAMGDGEVYGIIFPTAGMDITLPSSVDAASWPHYLEGGNTAVRTHGENGGYLVNSVREFVVPGGRRAPAGTKLFKMGPNGERIILREFND